MITYNKIIIPGVQQCLPYGSWQFCLWVHLSCDGGTETSKVPVSSTKGGTNFRSKLIAVAGECVRKISGGICFHCFLIYVQAEVISSHCCTYLHPQKQLQFPGNRKRTPAFGSWEETMWLKFQQPKCVIVNFIKLSTNFWTMLRNGSRPVL